MREKEFEALVIRARRTLSGLEKPEQMLDTYAMMLDENSAKETALNALSSLTAVSETVEESIWELATSLHESGTSYRVISEYMEIPTMTVKRRIEKIRQGRA